MLIVNIVIGVIKNINPFSLTPSAFPLYLNSAPYQDYITTLQGVKKRLEEDSSIINEHNTENKKQMYHIRIKNYRSRVKTQDC